MTIENLAHLKIMPEQSRGRRVAEAETAARSVFDRDRDRVIHSDAFRRLAYKTQVFVYNEGDHFRSRLTHSLEVAQIARSMARRLKLNEAITEAIALAHDFGHPPFGHTGEDALDDMMQPYGGFDHNAQSFALVSYLECGYAGFDGLNLCFETLDGILKHNGPLATPEPGSHLDQVLQFSQISGLVGADAVLKGPFLESQLAAIADDIAYTAHDLDDGLRAGMFKLEDVAGQPIVARALADIQRQHPDVSEERMIFEIKRRVITFFIQDIVQQVINSVSQLKLQTWRDICDMGRNIAVFSDKMQKDQKALFTFLFERLYRHDDVVKTRARTDFITRELFKFYSTHPDKMDVRWREDSICAQETQKVRIVCDFISGMTDRYAESKYTQHCV